MSLDGRSPELQLWVHVLVDSVVQIHRGWDVGGHARDWLLDPGNEFFEVAAEAVGYRPEVLRERVKRLVADRNIVSGHGRRLIVTTTTPPGKILRTF